MKLTKQQIQFINTYLINSNVIYIDIRYEMIDHIATAVEEKMEAENLDFYNAFKKYMVENKNLILKNNKEVGNFSWVEVKKYLQFLLKPTMFIFGVLICLIYRFVDIESCFSKDFTFNNMLTLVIFTICLFQIIYYYLYLKKRYYSIEKSGMTLFIIYYINMFLNPLYREENLITEMIIIYLVFGYLFYFFKEIKSFQKHKFNFAS